MDKKSKLRHVYIKKLLAESKKTKGYEKGGVTEQPSPFSDLLIGTRGLSGKHEIELPSMGEQPQEEDTEYSSLLKAFEREKQALAEKRKEADTLSAISYVASLAGQPLGVNTQPLEFGKNIRDDKDLADEYAAKADIIKKLKDKKTPNKATVFTLNNRIVEAIPDPKTGRIVYEDRTPGTASPETKAQIKALGGELVEVSKDKQTGETTAKSIYKQPKDETKKKASEDIDKKYIPSYLDWTGSGRATFDKNMQLMEGAKNELTQMTEQWGLFDEPGKIQAIVPDAAMSERVKTLMQDVQSTALASLRAALGSQFTEKEGERIQAMSFDPNLSPEANLKKLESSVQYLRDVAKDAEDKAGFYEEHGTLKGWKSGNQSSVSSESPKESTKPSWAK
jgi:hypothetical protein